MGVKRFLVAGGMASLVLIGTVLIVDEGLAQEGFIKAQCKQNPTICETAEQGMNNPQGFIKAQCKQNPAICETVGGAPEGGAPVGGAPVGGTPEGGAPTGAAGSDMATVSFLDALPSTGGPSVVLLLASALLLGSALLLVAFVRSVRP